MGADNRGRCRLPGSHAARLVKALFDTNILIDFLRGVPEARVERGRYSAGAISIITWMEIMVGADERVATETERFLAGFDLILLDAAIARRAVTLRQKHRIKLPDAIVWASAQAGNMLLITRNTRDFPVSDPSVRAPYQL